MNDKKENVYRLVRKNTNLTLTYLHRLVKMNNESPTPGIFTHFTATGSGKKTGYKRNFYSKNPVNFYKNIDLHDHNWMTLNTIKADKKGHLSRKDANIVNLNANYLDVDCLQAGVHPETFMHDFNKHLHSPHHDKIFDVLTPTVEQKSGHGVYLIFMYKHSVPLGNLSPTKKHEIIHKWKVTERSLVKHVNCFTRRRYGKNLADINSTNLGRILRMPNTINVKYQDPKQKFTKPAPSYITTITGKYYDFNKFADYVQHYYTPLFDRNYRQKTATNPLQTKKNPASKFWTKISTAQAENANPKRSSQLDLSNIKTSRYEYGTYHPHYGKNKKPWLRYNFTALDYLKDHGISWQYDDGGKNIKIFNQPGVNSNGGDLSSLTLTQTENKIRVANTGDPNTDYKGDPSRSYTQIARPSGRWDKVIGHSLDSLTQVIMLHDNISDVQQAHHIKNLWKKQYAAKGHTKSEFPWQKYGVGAHASHSNSIIQNDETLASSSKDNKLSVKDLYDMSFKGKILRKYWGNKKYNNTKFNNIEKNYQDTHNGDDLPNYDKLFNKLQIQNPKNYLKNDVIDNNIARNYLIHRRGISSALVNAQIKAGNIRGIKGYWYHPAKINKETGRRLKDKNGRNIKNYNKWAYKSPKVEFVQRRPRNAFEAHLPHRISPNANNSIYHDIKMQLHPKYSPKVGEQTEIPCGADYIGLQKTNDYYTDKNGRKHQIFNTEMIDKNHTGNYKKNKLVDAAGDHNYGFNVKTGNGTKNLYVFEAPIDALSHLDMQIKHYKDLKKNQPNNTKAIKKAHEAFTNSTYLSLSGAGGKTNTIQHFINAQYAQNNEYSHIICSFDNDAAGYSAAQQIMGEFGNRKNYSVKINTPNNKTNDKQVSADVPISRNRKPGMLTARIDANDKNSTFNKDWNDMTQSSTFKHYHFSKPAVRMNPDEYSLDNISQMYNEMEDVDKLYNERHPKEDKISIESDAQKADLYLQTSNKIDKNYKAGKEKVDGDNPRIHMMNITLNSMSKPGKDMFKKYMDYVGNYLSTSEIAQYSTKAFTNHYHHQNTFLQSQGVKDVMNKKYDIPKLYQDINKAMDSMSSNKSRKLFATAINARSNILKRQIYHHFHGTTVGRSKYKNIHNKFPRPEYDSDKLTSVAQSNLDQDQEYESLFKIRWGTKDYKKLQNTLSKIKKIYKNTVSSDSKKRVQSYKTLIGASEYSKIKLNQHGVYSLYNFRNILKKKQYQPLVNDINSINIDTDDSLRKRFSHKNNRSKSSRSNKLYIPKSIAPNHYHNYAKIVQDIGREQYFSTQNDSQKVNKYHKEAIRNYQYLSRPEQKQVIHYARTTPKETKDSNSYKAYNYLLHSQARTHKFIKSFSGHRNYSHYNYHNNSHQYHAYSHHKSNPSREQQSQAKIQHKRTNYRKLFMKQLHR